MKKILSLALCVLMLVSVLPMTAGAVTDGWETLTFSQNGPVFSVKATGFEAADANDTFAFTAVAYKGESEKVDEKTVPVTITEGELAANVNFEDGGEADVAINKVIVKLIDSGEEVLGDGKAEAEFSITPQSVDENGVYNNLTNGFYKPVIDGTTYISGQKRYFWFDTSKGASGAASDKDAIHDSNPSTTSDAYGDIADTVQRLQYITFLRPSELQIDRLVAYVRGNNACSFYLAKESGFSENAAGHVLRFAGADATGIKYLGNTESGYVSKTSSTITTTANGTVTVNRLVFDTDYVARIMVIDSEPATGGNYGVNEFLPYARVKDSISIGSNKPAAVTFKQDGAVFSVTATKLDVAACTLTAVAYDVSGMRLGKKVISGSVSAGVFHASVDFEDGGQAAPDSIVSVTLTLTDENGRLLADEKTFDITKEADSPLNGFYKKVDSVSYRDVYYHSINGTTIGASTPDGENHNKLTDGDLDTKIGMTSQVPEGRVYMYGTELSAAIDIDMVVLDYTLGTSEVYLSTNEPDNANLADFVGKQTKPGIYYAGKLTNKSGTVKIVMLPVKAESGEKFQYIIMSASGGEHPGEFHEMQLYTGVKAEEKFAVLADGPVAGSASVFTEGTEVANNAPAFSYGSKNGTDASFAVDGNENTAWISANDSAYRDYLILDLGASYIIDGLKLTMAEGSDQNFTVYGMNTFLNDARNSSISQHVSATGFKRTALTDTLSDISAGEEITEMKSYDAFRYLVFEQEAEAGTSFGFAEIEVYTLDGIATENKPVSKAKGELVVFSKDLTGAADTKFNEAKVNVPDSDPSTTTNVGYFNAGHNGQVVQTVMLDLQKEQKVSHIAYQSASKEHPSEYTYFVLVGANSLPGAGAYVTKDSSDTKVASLQNVDVLARFDGESDLTVSLGETSDETGLLIFKVPEAHRDKTYRYVGLLKYDTENAEVKGTGALELKTRVGTLHAYTRCEDVLDLVEASGKQSIIDAETVTITDSEVRYTATLWNGSVGGNLIGVLTNGETNQKYYVDCGVLIPGAYNSIGFNQTVTNGETGTWELTLLCGRKIYDRMRMKTDKVVKDVLYMGESYGEGIRTSRVGATIQSGGMVDAGMVGMVILKPDANPDAFGANDVHDHIFAEAPESASDRWNYSLRRTISGETDKTYIACLLSNNDSLTNEEPVCIKVLDEEMIAEAFDSAETSEIVDLMTATYADYFGEEFVQAVQGATGTDAQKAAFGNHFALAKVGFDNGIFATGLSDIEIITAAAQAAFVIDATLSGKLVADMIATYGASMPAIFDTADYDATDFEKILPSVLSHLVINNTATKENAEHLATAYKRTIALAMIANGDVAAREAAITNYSEALGIERATLDTKQEMGAIAQKLSSNINTVKNTYAGGMDKAIKEIIANLDKKATENNAETLGNRGGGGSRGSGGSTIVSQPYELWEEETTGRQEDETSAIYQITGFTDVDNHAWAHDAIRRMKERGVINGVSETAFAPDDALTREQAAKFAVLTMQLDTSMEDNGFLDCVYNSWYYPFVSAAVEHGLVNGISMLDFGVGQKITRQDLAVIIYRGLNQLKLVEGLEKKSFADDDSISSYAQDAVGVLGNMGIITGFPDGSFGPRENATRAQATVIFARFLDYIEAATSAGEEG